MMNLKQWKSKALIPIGLILSLCLLTQPSSYAAENQYSRASPESSTYLIRMDKADLTGDSIPDTIIFSGTKRNPSSSYYDKLNIRVVSPSDSQTINIVLTGGYNPSLKLLDVNGDHISDICLSTSQDSNGDTSSLLIYSIQNHQAVPVPLPAPLNIKGMLKDNYKASVTIQNTNQTYMLNLLERRTLYDAMGYYQNSRLLKSAKAIVNGYTKLEPIDRDKDGTWELKGIQPITIPSNDNTIALAESLWKWRYNQWTLVNAKIVSTF
ncbi:hypothetical protein [Paenibacillus sp. RC67]|uniref:hypothetical protein n=1 Tax=Paenibacillus sp. RC67 TaxID=3039392 RepID=UPI0024AD5A91|nr:hypothetical protein [Paenibacillus sp. RC67]